ncbi:hypothetical protein [Pinisolibacter sp.]|uniref:hypothetical protein n=1 Tax=Pinisolibacter sp. TaxID=2172024 RepID=UPI002FDCD28A
MIRMRFLTPAWERGRDEDAPARLLAHLGATFGEPSDPLRLATEIGLHDGIVRRLTRTRRDLVLRVTTGHLGIGYRDVDLVYRGPVAARCEGFDLVDLTGPGVEILRDEIDRRDDGAIVHRMRLTIGGLEIVAGGFALGRIAERRRR